MAELPKKPKKLLKKLVCASPTPAVPELPADLDKCTKISINGREMRIAADDLQFVCKLGELEEVVYFLYVGHICICWLAYALLAWASVVCRNQNFRSLVVFQY